MDTWFSRLALGLTMFLLVSMTLGGTGMAREGQGDREIRALSRGQGAGIGSTRLFYEPAGIATDGGKYVYVADAGDGQIKQLSPRGVLLAAWSSDDLGVPAPFEGPGPIAVDSQGNLYVGDYEIFKLSPRGKMVAHWPLRQRAGLQTSVVGITTDRYDHVFVLYRDGQAGGPTWTFGIRVVKLSTRGKVLNVWPINLPRFTHVSPGAFAVDHSGRIYVAITAATGCYRECDEEYSFLYTLSPSGVVVAELTLGEDTSEMMSTPPAYDGLAVDRKDHLYLESWGRIEKRTRGGRLLAAWSAVGCSGPGLGWEWHGLAFDARSRLYVAGMLPPPPDPTSSSLDARGIVEFFSTRGHLLARWGC